MNWKVCDQLYSKCYGRYKNLWDILPTCEENIVIESIYEHVQSKVRCCKEQYCIGTWNVKSMNQNKFEVVKQEVARVNIYILGIGELIWTGMGMFNSDSLCTYYCGQEMG